MMEQMLPFLKNGKSQDVKKTAALPNVKPVVEVDLVRSLDDLNAAFELRRQAFVIEKGVPEQDEFDGNDFTSTQILLKVNNIPAATLRARCFKDFAKVERVCVAKQFRGKGLYRPLLDYTEEYLKEKGYDCFVGYILKELTNYWFERGFCPNPKMQEVKKANLTLVPVIYPFKKAPVVCAKHHMDLLSREYKAKIVE